MSGELHAIDLEVGSNEIRLLRLMMLLKVNSGTSVAAPGKTPPIPTMAIGWENFMISGPVDSGGKRVAWQWAGSRVGGGALSD